MALNLRKINLITRQGRFKIVWAINSNKKGRNFTRFELVWITPWLFAQRNGLNAEWFRIRAKTKVNQL